LDSFLATIVLQFVVSNVYLFIYSLTPDHTRQNN